MHSPQTWIVLALIAFLSGCMSAEKHGADVNAATSAGSNLTVGTVQKEIRIGMSGEEVATVLGSPNIVTTDDKRREVWVYDKISTTRAYSTSGVAGSLILLGASREVGAASTSQQTLTVVIKFDEQKRVRDFAYNTSRF